MAVTHRLSLLFIILISGFKLGITAPADGAKGEDRVGCSEKQLTKSGREKRRFAVSS